MYCNTIPEVKSLKRSHEVLLAFVLYYCDAKCGALSVCVWCNHARAQKTF